MTEQATEAPLSQTAMIDQIAEPREEWTMVIRPQRGWFDLRLSELWRARDLILLFVRRDFVSVYKQTILGPLWYVIQPVLTTVTFTVVFGNIANLPADGLPHFLFYLAGTVIWSYFAACFTKTSNTFVQNASLFGKVYFPRLAVPVSISISNLITFGIQLVLLLLAITWFGLRGSSVRPNEWALLTPILLVMMAALGLGFGIVVSSLTTRYRDLQHLVTFGVQLLMYATPVIYPVSAIPEKYRLLILANPMSAIIESFRHAYLGAGTINPFHLLYSALFACAVLLVGVLMFNRVEQNFMDTV